MSGFMRVSSEDSVGIIRFDRPPANAFELESTREFCAVFGSQLADARVAAIVLTGNGECFSAGLDLKIVPKYNTADQRAMVQVLNDTVLAVYSSGKPVVAAVNGHAVAAGTLFTLCCDYRIGPRSDARFGLTGTRVGIPYPVAAFEVIRAELGMPSSRQTLLGATTFSAEEAMTKGILDELVSAESVLARACDVARDLAGLPSDNYSNLKHQLRSETIKRIARAMPEDPALKQWV